MSEELKKEEGAEASEKKEVEVPEKFKPLVEQIEKMSVLELSELVKVLEEKFGVSAAAPMMMAAGAPAAGGEAGEAVEEKSEFDIELVSSGDSKINVIKAVREITGQGLKDAKDLVDAAPKVIKEKATKAEAEEIKKKLEDAGATVTLK
jgi:large subunit ribosomal protein L7/L12